MSDEALRALEREILAAPASLELRRRHAQQLLRLGLEDRALAAIDLAWRLGADDLWDELQGRLSKRRLEVRGITLCYVPAGPFVMGADDLDLDARPAHLVLLSAFYVAEEPLTWKALDGWRADATRDETDVWPLTDRGPYRETFLRNPVRSLAQEKAIDAIAYLDRVARPGGLTGRWSLISEAQWERVFRSAHLRPDGVSPYGARHPTRPERAPEWTADGYDPDAYGQGPRRDPVEPVKQPGQLRVVRGIAALPPPHFAIYREAAGPTGSFEIERKAGTAERRTEEGIGVRPVFVP